MKRIKWQLCEMGLEGPAVAVQGLYSGTTGEAALAKDYEKHTSSLRVKMGR